MNLKERGGNKRHLSFCMILGGKLDYKVGQYLVKVVE